MVVQVIRRRAVGPTRSVVSGASGTASATCAPANSEPAPLDFMARNGSLTCYAAFIRHVRRIPRQRRRGPSRFHREQYWLARLAGSGVDDGTLESIGSAAVGDDGTIEVVTLQVIRSHKLPGMVTQLHRGDLRIRREETWGPVTGGAATGSVEGSIVDAPVNLSGTAVLAPIAETGGPG